MLLAICFMQLPAGVNLATGLGSDHPTTAETTSGVLLIVTWLLTAVSVSYGWRYELRLGLWVAWPLLLALNGFELYFTIATKHWHPYVQASFVTASTSLTALAWLALTVELVAAWRKRRRDCRSVLLSDRTRATRSINGDQEPLIKDYSVSRGAEPMCWHAHYMLLTAVAIIQA